MQLDRYGDKSLEVVLKKDGNQEEKIITEMTNQGSGPKMVEKQDGEMNLSPTNTSKDHLKAEQLSQNNF